MSQDKKKQKKQKVSASTLATRILCIILAALMVMGAVILIIQMFSINSYAYPENQILRVGLMYGADGVTVGFETTSESGFTIGSVDTDNGYSQLWQVTDTKVSVTCDANLSKSGMTYAKTSSLSPNVGGYHIQLVSDSVNFSGLMAQLAASLSGYNLMFFPAYINGQYCIRIGCFANEASAADMLAKIMPVAGSMAYVVAPSPTAVSVVNPETDVILYEYDCGDASHLGMKAVQGLGRECYIVTPAQNSYTGVFEYSRFREGSKDGVAVTNVLPLDDYVMGVLPWEISNSWPIEVQKAFAVTVRSFALSMLGRHDNTYGFDLCNSTHCQAYRGMNRVNDTVRQAVASTAGEVLTYDGKIAKTYYSAVTGGTTVSATEAWGGTAQPYLRAIYTPWEQYSTHQKGSWTSEITPTELLSLLREEGNTNLSGAIASVNVDSYAENSAYVYKMTFTDIYGNKATVSKSDNIRILLSGYVRSANFVVAKAGETVTLTDYSLANYTGGQVYNSPAAEAMTEQPAPRTSAGGIVTGESMGGAIVQGAPDGSAAIVQSVTDTADSTSQGVHVMTENGVIIAEIDESINVVKSLGSERTLNLTALPVLTEGGLTAYNMAEENALYFDSLFEDIGDPSAVPVTPVDISKISLSNVVATTRTEVAAGTPGNFVFIGRGWGHGVGLSQWGARDLAKMGYDYKTILTTYFPGTVISNCGTIS